MYKSFELVRYPKEVVDQRFSGMINAFKFGAPPHGGCAFGIDRLIMLLLDEPNLREVIAFPPNGKGMDLMMGGPSYVEPEQLRELNIELSKKAKDLMEKELNKE
jgi:aspartyl-tRNA synthetase